MTSLFIAGDSTASIKSLSAYPETGWGEAFRFLLCQNIVLFNHAVNGRSITSFSNEGLWENLLTKVQSGDYVLIQFGHNDEKIEDPLRYSSPGQYQTLLTSFIKDIRRIDAIPIILSSISRRLFENDHLCKDTIGIYPELSRKVAKKEKVLFIDAYCLTHDAIEKLGPEESREWFLHFEANEVSNYPLGIQDNTHLSHLGAMAVAKLIAQELKKHPQTKALIDNF